MQEDYSDKALWFVAGAAVGATLALLFAPASRRTRAQIGRTAERGRDYVMRRDAMSWTAQGLYEKGRKIADDAAELFERGKRWWKADAGPPMRLQGRAVRGLLPTRKRSRHARALAGCARIRQGVRPPLGANGSGPGTC